MSCGALGILQELCNNKDMCIALVCTSCGKLATVCWCVDGKHHVPVRIPYSTVLLNEYMATTRTKALKFTVCRA